MHTARSRLAGKASRALWHLRPAVEALLVRGPSCRKGKAGHVISMSVPALLQHAAFPHLATYTGLKTQFMNGSRGSTRRVFPQHTFGSRREKFIPW